MFKFEFKKPTSIKKATSFAKMTGFAWPLHKTGSVCAYIGVEQIDCCTSGSPSEEGKTRSTIIIRRVQRSVLLGCE